MSAVLSLREAGEKLAAKRREVREIVEKHTVEGELKMDAATVENLRQRNAELKDLGERYDLLKEAEDIAGASRGDDDRGELAPDGGRKGAPLGDAHGRATRTVAGLIAKSAGLVAWRAGAERKNARIFELDLNETKALISLGTISPQADRRADIVPIANAYQGVTDLLRQGNTNSNAIEYYEETTFTNNAAETAEGAAKPESGLAFTLRSEPVRKIATWIPITDEALSDNARLESYVTGRLRDMVIRRRERQVLLGDGLAPNLLGIRNRTGVQIEARGTNPVFDAVLRAMVAVQTTGDANPNAVIMPPTVWRDLLLTRTADGLYILGNPGDQLATQRLWGLAVRAVPGYTATEALVGDFTMAEFVRRSGLAVTASSEHSTFFVENKIVLLAEERAALEVDRPAAFCAVTGL